MDEELLTELPPLDGDEDEQAPPEVPDLEGEDVATDEDALDDATGEMDPAEFLPDSLDAGGADVAGDAEESRELDVGGIEPLGAEGESLLTDTEEGGTEGEVLDIEEQEEGVRDAGEEGPSEEDDSQALQELPPIDADEEGAPEEEAFFDGIVEELAAPWADDAWEKFAEYSDVDATAELVARLGIVGLDATVPAVDAAKLRPGMTTVRATAEVAGFLACARANAGQDASIVFLFSEESGARTIAELGTPDAFEISRLGYDAQTGVLWVVGEFGLVGLRRPAR